MAFNSIRTGSAGPTRRFRPSWVASNETLPGDLCTHAARLHVRSVSHHELWPCYTGDLVAMWPCCTGDLVDLTFRNARVRNGCVAHGSCRPRSEQPCKASITQALPAPANRTGCPRVRKSTRDIRRSIQKFAVRLPCALGSEHIGCSQLQSHETVQSIRGYLACSHRDVHAPPCDERSDANTCFSVVCCALLDADDTNQPLISGTSWGQPHIEQPTVPTLTRACFSSLC